MKHVMIFGAGQAGRMAAAWLPADQKLDGFIDNNENLQGSMINGIPVCSLGEAVKTGMPDQIWLAVINREACHHIKDQLTNAGFTGEICTVHELRSKIDMRLASLRLLADQIRERDVSGSIAELGVYQGTFAAELNRLFPQRNLYLFDTFEGFAEEDLITERKLGGRNAFAVAGDFSDTSVEIVLGKMSCPEYVYICQGHFPESLSGGAIQANGKTTLTAGDLKAEHYAGVSLDTDLYEPTRAGLQYFYPRLNPGGFILLHDYHSTQYPGVHRAADEFFKEQGIYCTPIPDLHGTAVIIKGQSQ